MAVARKRRLDFASQTTGSALDYNSWHQSANALDSFMRTYLLALLIAAAPFANSQTSLPRPPITGVSHVAFYAKNPEASRAFYAGLLGLATSPSRPNLYLIGTKQAVEIEQLPPGHGTDLISHVAFATTDAEGLRKYLAALGVKVPQQVSTGGTSRWFAMADPDGHPIEFVQEEPRPASGASAPTLKPISQHMIHAGFWVHDRAAEDRFYKDLLGFRLYWHGGMKDDETDWVDMQVPDGTDWLEYMLLPGQGQPSARTLGVINHIALGVPSIADANNLLQTRAWKPGKDEHAQIGKDGKWQLNLYDPDGTRVELMEFRPVQKPCCSEYTGQHPQ